MTKLTLEVRKSSDTESNSPHAIKIQVGSTVLTRLFRFNASSPDEYLNAPPLQLAFWLVDNWWRLRWECAPIGKPTADWLLSHCMSSIGGGFAWPRVTFWGDGALVTIKCLSDPVNVLSPVRFLSDALQYVDPLEFESAVDRFFTRCTDEIADFGNDRLALLSQVDALNSERNDPRTAAWRRLEAQSGYDVDQAPDDMMMAIARLIGRYGESGVDEAVQGAPGAESAIILSDEIALARQRGFQCDFSAVVDAVTALDKDIVEPAWITAEGSAGELRKLLVPKGGRLSDRKLLDLVGLDVRALDQDKGSTNLAYGLRLKEKGNGKHRVLFKSRWKSSRRFELARAIGDVVWKTGDKLGPLTDSKTARQQFQRAFSQSLLCPFDELKNYIGTDQPSSEDISAASKHFDVSEGVVRTTLVNKGVIDRSQLDEFSDAMI